MKILNLLLNYWTVCGCAAAITVAGASMENPDLTIVGLNLGTSSGVATLISKKSQRQQQDNQILTEIRSLTEQIETIETNTKQQQDYLAANLEHTDNNLQTLQSQHQHTIREQKQLSFTVSNTQRQLNNHSKKLKKQQHEINTQKTNQNKITSNIQKLKNQQKVITTNQTQCLGKIEAQVDKLIDNSPKQFTQSVPQKKVIAPIIHARPQTLCYIDNNNLYNCLKEIGVKPDYRALLSFLNSKTDQIQIKLYDGAFANQKYRYAHLKQLGYQINTLPIVKRENDQFKTVGDDVRLAIDMVKDVREGDSVILITGDGDLIPAVKEIKQHNVYITLIAKQSAVNHNLRQLADEFISLESIKYDIAEHSLFSA